MPASQDETPDDSTLPTHDAVPATPASGASNAVNADAPAAADTPIAESATEPTEPSPTPAANSDEPDSLDIDAEFLRLSAELDDIPGFRFHGAPPPGHSPQTHPAGPRDWPATPEVEALEEAESHFIPPDPELRLDGDPVRVLGWAFVAIGVLGLLVGGILHTVLPTAVLATAGVILVVGVALLLWRMPTERADDDANDHGAQF